MDRYNESISDTNTQITKPHVIDYPELVDTVQLSAARLIDVRGALQAETFAEVLESHDESEREHLIARVGAQFDESLVSFVTASLIGRRHQDVVILAEASEGFGGYLPWQARLDQHIQNLQNHGLLQTVSLRVERYSTADDAIEGLTDQARELAGEIIPEYYTA